MAAGTTIQLKRKAGAFTGGQLAAGEAGIDTTNGAFYFSVDGSTVSKIGGTGTVLQVKSTTYSTQTSGTTTIPVDNTIPQNTEGTEIMSVSLAPANSANRLLVISTVVMGGNTTQIMGPALFRDSTADAIAYSEFYNPGAGYVTPLPLVYEFAAGSTSSTTLKIRIGAHTGTWYVNYRSAGETHGAVVRSALTVFEISA